MLFQSGLLVFMLGCTTALTVPRPQEHRLEDIQCRCLSFSTSAKPTLCTYLESHGIDWQTAYTLASDNDLRIQFASKETISKVLAIPRPLPTSILQTIGEGEAQPLRSTELLQSQNKIICGLDDEVKHMGNDQTHHDLEADLNYVSTIIAFITVFLIFYVAGVHLYNRFTAKEGIIKLEGDEKALMASMQETNTETPLDFF